MKTKENKSIRVYDHNRQLKFNPKVGYDLLILPTPKSGIKLTSCK